MTESPVLDAPLADPTDDLMVLVLPGVKVLSVDLKLLFLETNDNPGRGERLEVSDTEGSWGEGATNGAEAKLTVERRFLLGCFAGNALSSSASLPSEWVLSVFICLFLDAVERKKGSMQVSRKLPTYPSPTPTLTHTSDLRQNVGSREGWVGQSFRPSTYY